MINRLIGASVLIILMILNYAIFACIVTSFFLFPEVSIPPYLYILGLFAVCASTWIETILLRLFIKKKIMPNASIIADVIAAIVFVIMYSIVLFSIATLDHIHILIVFVFEIAFISPIFYKKELYMHMVK